MRLVFASNNEHKLSEVRGIMPIGIEVLSLREIGFDREMEETGATLAENSLIKAKAVWDYVQTGNARSVKDIDGIFADDTGLEIDALNREPGVYTARWYKKEPTISLPAGKEMKEADIFAANRAKALRELQGKTDRGAQFRTVITLINLKQEIMCVEGVVRGKIATEEYGEGGFGYDPIFIPEGYNKTFGELPVKVKNSISHRARALEALVRELRIEK